ncbi:MAG: Crp/Fnr family transcriptional regulator [Bryobacteraceae bacterium]
MSAARIQILRRIPLFASLSPAELAPLAERTLEKRFHPAEVLFREGDPCHGFYLLGQGTVKIFKTSPSGREIMLAVETAPSSVAEVPLFDGGPFPATVSALDEVVAYLVSTRDFRQVCHQHPEVALKLLAVVGGRLRQLVGVVEAVSFGSVRQRLARTLLDLARQAGSMSYSLPATHQELASRLGTVREVISRNLSRFQAEGLIRVDRKHLQILNPDGLESEAETEF